MSIQKVLIVGAGRMGAGIAQVCAQAGLHVIINDISEDLINKALKDISWSVKKFIEKGKLTEKESVILDRVSPSLDPSCAAKVDLVIEAVFEQLNIKKEVFKRINEFSKPHTLIASNTSAIPITELAAKTTRPQNVLGLHFFNPAALMPVVEVIRGINTSEAVMQAGIGFVKQLNKEPIRVETDVPGFLLNRINLISYVEAICLVEKNIGTIEEIDKGMRRGFGRKMGPFETGDMVGLDVSYGALLAIYQESQDIRYYPPQLLRRKVMAGDLGRKTGRGWYEYNKDGNRREN